MLLLDALSREVIARHGSTKVSNCVALRNKKRLIKIHYVGRRT